MAKQVNIHAAKTHFSKLCEEAEAGAEIVIARSGKPILKLVRVEEEPTPALKEDFGFAKGMITQADGGYLTPLGQQVAEQAQALVTLLGND